MKHTITILTILISFLGYSQDFEEISENEDISSEIRILETAKIAVSSMTTVHTYALNNNTKVAVEDADLNTQFSVSNEVTALINTFLAIEGVTECSFDRATQTFTIVTGSLTDLTSCVNKINKK